MSNLHYDMRGFMETNALVESIKFMFLGMGVVFTFLTIMVYAIKIQAKLIAKFFPVLEKQPVVKTNIATNKDEMAKKVAAMIAVIHHEQSDKK